jgi:hypothetical protein
MGLRSQSIVARRRNHQHIPSRIWAMVACFGLSIRVSSVVVHVVVFLVDDNLKAEV